MQYQVYISQGKENTTITCHLQEIFLDKKQNNPSGGRHMPWNEFPVITQVPPELTSSLAAHVLQGHTSTRHLPAHPCSQQQQWIVFLSGDSCLYFTHCLTDWVCKSTEPTHAMEIQLLYPTAPLRGGKTVFSVCFGLGLVLGKFAWFVFF